MQERHHGDGVAYLLFYNVPKSMLTPIFSLRKRVEEREGATVLLSSKDHLSTQGWLITTVG